MVDYCRPGQIRPIIPALILHPIILKNYGSTLAAPLQLC